MRKDGGSVPIRSLIGNIPGIAFRSRMRFGAPPVFVSDGIERLAGYPASDFVGEQIPLVGRIVAIADVFDALPPPRPYKPEWPLEKKVGYLRQQRGQHFDGRLADLFLAQMPALLELKQRWAEQSAA